MSGELPRAYLRVDPNIDQAYPELRNTFVGLLCSAARQTERGRYRSLAIAEQLHSRAFIARSLRRGDLVLLGDGRLYIPGWDEWQEGDLTVAERMRRMRGRRRSGRDTVTPQASHERNDVTNDAYANGESESRVSRPLGVGVGVGARGARDGMPDITGPVAEAVERITGRGVLALGASAQSCLDDLCRRHPEGRVLDGLDTVAAAVPGIPSGPQLVFGLRNLLDRIPHAPAAGTPDPAASEAASARRTEASQRQLHGYGGHRDSPSPRCPLCRESEVAS